MITTNLRLYQDDLTQYKSLAADLDMSFNELVSATLELLARKPEIAQQLSKKKLMKTDQVSIWDLPKMAIPFKKSAAVDWNEDDQIVYDL